MNEMNEQDDEAGFTEAEREALASWQVPGAPGGLAERVLERDAASRGTTASGDDARMMRVVALAAAACWRSARWPGG